MPERHRMPEPLDPIWGATEVRWPDNTPDWFAPFERFLEKYSPAFKKTFFRRVLGFFRIPVFQVTWGNDLDLHLPGDNQGVTVLPRLIQLSLPTRWSLFREFYYRPSNEILQKWRMEGAFILFRQVAYAEFWLENGFLTWPILWVRNKPHWHEKAEFRAGILLQVWELNDRIQSERKKKPPAPPL